MKSDILWTIKLLGRLQVSGMEQTMHRFRTRKTASLLAYLALNHHKAHPRSALAELFWPESEPKAGHNSLRVAITSLRKQLEPNANLKHRILLAQSNTLQLNAVFCQTDVDLFEQNLEAAEDAEHLQDKITYWNQALQQYQGGLLPGESSLWAEQATIRLSDLHHNTICHLGQALLISGELHQALSYAHKGIHLDPLCEESHFLLMQIYSQLNRPARAIQQYHDLRFLCQQEFDRLPSPKIQQWINHLIAS